MRYFGGKQRLAKELSTIINRYDVKQYHEPFCGMYSVGAQVTVPRRSGSDVLPDIIELLKAVQNGWYGPTTLTEAEFKGLRQAEPSALRAFAGFGCSFAGKFLKSYARDSRGTNFAQGTHNSLAKLAPKIAGVRFTVQSYADYDGKAEVLYCDPPYSDAVGYARIGKFDNAEFWRWAREEARRRIVLISEYTAPPWATAIWEHPITMHFNSRKNAVKTMPRIEKLFTIGV